MITNLIDKKYNVGSYSNFIKYIKSKEIKVTKATKEHTPFATSSGRLERRYKIDI